MPDGSQAPGEGDRIPSLDGLRGAAAMSVVYWHYVSSISRAAPGSALAYLAKLGGLTWSGVDLFFVLSGYLITRNLLRHSDFENALRVFYARRALRIVPLYGAVLGSFYLAKWILLSNDPLTSSPQAALPMINYLTFTQNIAAVQLDTFGPHWLAPTWSLGVEEQFYLLAPLLVLRLARRPMAQVLLTLIVIAAVVRLWASPMGAYTLLPSRMDAVAAGCLIALAGPTRGARLEDASRRPSAIVVAALVSLALACGVYLEVGGGLRAATTGLGTFNLSWIAAGYSLIIVLVLRSPMGILARVLRARFLVRAGWLSYGIYLLHMPVLLVVARVFTGEPPELRRLTDLWIPVLALGLTWIVAEASFHFIEAPCSRIGQAIRYKRINGNGA